MREVSLVQLFLDTARAGVVLALLDRRRVVTRAG
jgi:hypothetical protein